MVASRGDLLDCREGIVPSADAADSVNLLLSHLKREPWISAVFHFYGRNGSVLCLVSLALSLNLQCS